MPKKQMVKTLKTCGCGKQLPWDKCDRIRHIITKRCMKSDELCIFDREAIEEFKKKNTSVKIRAVCSKLFGHHLLPATRGLAKKIKMLTIHRASSDKLLVTLRCLEYTHQFYVCLRSDQIKNILLLFKNILKLNYSKTDTFTLAEILIIARDQESFERFLKKRSITSR